MEIKYKSSVLLVKEIEKSKNFYQNILKQEIRFDFGECIEFVGGFSIFQKEYAKKLIFGSKQKNDTITKNLNAEFYFETNEINEIASKIKSIGLEILHDVKEEPWGQKTFRFFDHDNHIIEIGESMEVFVNRFYLEGMNAIEISERTSVPLETVKSLISSKP